MFGGMTHPHCLLNADARRELPKRRQRASPPRLGRECPVRAAKRFSACDRFALPDAFGAGVVLPHGRLPHYSRFRLKSQRRNRRKTGGVGTLTAGKAPQKPGSVFKAPPALPPGVFRVSRVRSAGNGGKPGGSAVRPGREGMAVLHRRWDDPRRIVGAFHVSRVRSVYPGRVQAQGRGAAHTGIRRTADPAVPRRGVPFLHAVSGSLKGRGALPDLFCSCCLLI